MWTLAEARTRLTDRLAEDSTVFWSSEMRDAYINDAQRFIAAITRGVEEELTAAVSSSAPYITLPDRVTNAHPAQAYVVGGRVLNVIPLSTANLVDPNWRSTIAATPLWVVPHFTAKRAYLSPRPRSPVDVVLVVSVLPTPVSIPTDRLFNGQDGMAKYLNAFVNMAASFALIKERYEGEAERFYQLAVAEVGSLGIVLEDVPPFSLVRESVRSEQVE